MKTVANNLFCDFDFNDKTDFIVEEINGVKLPKDYLEFMVKHNGGEGPLGKNAYLVLFCLEELANINEEYEISKYHKNFFVFGSDGGSMLLGYNNNIKKYYMIDLCNIDDDNSNRFLTSDTLEELFINMDKE